MHGVLQEMAKTGTVQAHVADVGGLAQVEASDVAWYVIVTQGSTRETAFIVSWSIQARWPRALRTPAPSRQH